MAESECELCGELSYRGGERRHFAVRSQLSIQGILGGVRRLQQQLSGPLSELVLQEKQQQQRVCAESPASSSAGEDEDDTEDEPDNKGDGDAPPVKRTRKQC